MRILAIETSCDETAIAIADFSGSKTKPTIRILSHIVSSQVKLHATYGGVVPNLAKREHQRNLVPILVQALKETKLPESRIKNQESREKRDGHDSCFIIRNSILAREPELLERFTKRILPFSPPPIDAIAVTNGPGLAPALWVGVNFAKALAYLWKKPLIPVNHMEGHLISSLIKQRRNENDEFLISNIKFPVLSLLVSGGHTELVLVKKWGDYKIIGETLDDAAGEAFDKVARILGLRYPGGPEISRLALGGNPQKYKLPRPMMNSKNFDFSFSGLKTAVFSFTREHKRFSKKDLAASFEKAVIDVLVSKTVRAAKKYRAKTLLMGGGVAANKHLQTALAKTIHKEIPRSLFLAPDSSLTGDNALMIATAAYFSGKKKAPTEVRADANAVLDS